MKNSKILNPTLMIKGKIDIKKARRNTGRDHQLVQDLPVVLMSQVIYHQTLREAPQSRVREVEVVSTKRDSKNIKNIKVKGRKRINQKK